jgi:CubicO group peptidase (beta-lactamase class C family)
VERDSLIQNALSQYANNGTFTKCVVGMLVKNQQEWHKSFICLNTPQQTVFDVASVTKSVPTALLALQILLQHPDMLQYPLYKALPLLNTPYKEQITLAHALTHTLDYRFSLASLKDHTPQQILHTIYNHPFEHPPGSQFLYCNSSSILLGQALESICGEPLHTLAHTKLFAPMQLQSTGFAPPSGATVLPTEQCPWRQQVVHGTVHDESAHALGRPVGSAGLFSNAPDLLQVCQMILQDGVYHEQAIVPKGVLKLCSTNATPHLSTQTALGWELCQTRFMGHTPHPNRFGKTGFTGSSIVICPNQQKALVLLTNYTWPTRKPNANAINAFRTHIANVFFDSI